jgi:peroxiredoxin (alkyl hydroperoxide reductase subunit C)
MILPINSEKLVRSYNILAFIQIDTEVIAASVDSHFSHREYTLKKREEGGLGGMKIPLLSDLTRKIS